MDGTALSLGFDLLLSADFLAAEALTSAPLATEVDAFLRAGLAGATGFLATTVFDDLTGDFEADLPAGLAF